MISLFVTLANEKTEHIFLTHLKRQNPKNIGSGSFWILN